MIYTNIKDARGRKLQLDADNTVPIVIHGHPPLENERVLELPFSQFFTTNGSATGSNNMVVAGTLASPIDFYVKANEEYDIYIDTVSIQISDNGSALDKFGALTALTNGVQFIYSSIRTGEYIIADAIKTNLDFFREATGGKGFGSGTDAFKADISGGGQDTYFPEIDLTERYNLYHGLRIERGTTGRLIMRVRDNLAGISVFNVKCFGKRLQIDV